MTKEDIWNDYYAKLRRLAYNTPRSTPKSRRQRLELISNRDKDIRELESKA